MAVAVGTPAIVILGGGFGDRFFSYPSGRWEKVWHPMNCYHCFWKCIYSEPKCITSITTDEVFAVSKELLSRSRHSHLAKPLASSGGKGIGEAVDPGDREKANNRIGFLNFQIAAWRKAYEEVNEERGFWRRNYQVLESDRDNWKNNFETLLKTQEDWRKNYEAMERDREEWKTNYGVAESDRENWKNNYEVMETDRNNWRDGFGQLEKQRDELSKTLSDILRTPFIRIYIKLFNLLKR
jgi:hypothetical protein